MSRQRQDALAEAGRRALEHRFAVRAVTWFGSCIAMPDGTVGVTYQANPGAARYQEVPRKPNPYADPLR